MPTFWDLAAQVIVKDSTICLGAQIVVILQLGTHMSNGFFKLILMLFQLDFWDASLGHPTSKHFFSEIYWKDDPCEVWISHLDTTMFENWQFYIETLQCAISDTDFQSEF